MAPQADPQTRRLVLAYSGTARQVRARVEQYVRRFWGSLPDYRGGDIDRFVRQVVPVVAGGQRRVSALTDAYLATIATATLGVRVRPVGIPRDVISSEVIRGVPAADVYGRAGPTVWTALSNGTSFTDAVGMGLDRMLATAATDLQLARTHTARYVFGKSDKVVGYRRVPGGGNVCGLCAVAATQRYHVEDLMPIHDRCSCDVEPIFGAEDPGQVIDPEGLEGIHQEIEDRLGTRTNDAAELKRQVVVNNHGEIGPVLGVRGQTFTGPNDF